METKRYCWEDFPVGRVMALGSTPVTREAMLAFAQQFDPQPFHLDDAAAEASLFKKLSASVPLANRWPAAQHFTPRIIGSFRRALMPLPGT